MDALRKQELFGMATSLRYNKIAQGFIAGAVRFEDKAKTEIAYYRDRIRSEKTGFKAMSGLKIFALQKNW